MQDSVDARVMPKLCELEINEGSGWEPDLIIPSHLPTVTELTFDKLNIALRRQVDMLRGFTALRSLKIIGIKMQMQRFVDSGPILLPHLHTLHIYFTPGYTLEYFQLPALSWVVIETNVDPHFSVDVDRALANLSRTLELFRDPFRAAHLHISTFSAAHNKNDLMVFAHGPQGEVLVTFSVCYVLSIGFPSICSNSYTQFHNRLFQVLQSTNAEVSRIDTGTKQVKDVRLKILFHSLRERQHVSTVHIWSRYGFLDFLTFSNSDTVQCSHQGFPEQPYGCVECKQMRVMSFSGLKTILFENIDEKFLLNEASCLEAFCEWLKERQGRDFGLKEIILKCKQVEVGQEIMDRLAQFVKKVEVVRVPA